LDLEGEGEAVLDVGLNLGVVEGAEFVKDEDALAELAEAAFGEAGLELGLADEDDLQEFLGVGFEVGEEAELLHDFEGEVLGFVDDEDDVLAGVDAAQEGGVEAAGEVGVVEGEGAVGGGVGDFAEFAEDGGEEFAFGEAGVENEGGFDAGGVEFVEEGAAEGGFAAADFAGEDDEAGFLGEAVAEVGEGVVVGGAEVKETGVGGDVEGHHAETEELLVHGGSGKGGRSGKREKWEAGRAPKRIMIQMGGAGKDFFGRGGAKKIATGAEVGCHQGGCRRGE